MINISTENNLHEIMIIKYGFKWTKEGNEWLGVHQESDRYAISSSLNNDGSWSHELLTKQKLWGSSKHTYELPCSHGSQFETKNIQEIVKVINQRVDYWKSNKSRYYSPSNNTKAINYYAIAMENRMSKFLQEPDVNYR